MSEFGYLVITISQSGTFRKAIKALCERAMKAMYSVIHRTRQFNLPLSLQRELFDKLVAPILLYASESWGYENLAIIGRFHVKFLKFMLKVKSSTPTYMVLGELGEYIY